MKPLLAWDIDGTLLTSGGAGRNALNGAFFECFGTEDVFLKVDFRGRIDPSLIQEAFDVAGRAYDAADAARLKETYLRRLREELSARSAVMTVHPGALEAVLRCAPFAHNALLTGNWREGAFAKLEAADLDRHFSWGAFGGDGVVRNDLVPVLRRRAKERGIDAERVIVIGDTPADVACARADNAEVVAVTTGGCSREELAAAEPDLLVSDLQTDAEAFFKFLAI